LLTAAAAAARNVFADTTWKDHIQLQDYEVQNGQSLELYYS